MAALCAGGRRPAREIATRELRSECSISRPALALPPPTGTAATFTPQASRRSPVGRLAPPGPAATHRHRSHLHPAGHASLFLWLLRLLLQHSTTAGNTPDEIGEHSGSQRDKTLLAQHINRRIGTDFSLLVIKRSFWPVLRMQGEFYPGILVGHGPHPGSAMPNQVHLTVTSPMTDTRG